MFEISCFQDNIFTMRFYLTVKPCVTSESGVFLHNFGKQNWKNVVPSFSLLKTRFSDFSVFAYSKFLNSFLFIYQLIMN